jgi:hypothetical protein
MIRAARRDTNEKGIVDVLRRAGALVYRLDERDLPDLLVGYRRRWHLLEVKQEKGPRGGTNNRNLSPGQATFFLIAERMDLSVAVVRNGAEALRAIGIDIEEAA